MTTVASLKVYRLLLVIFAFFFVSLFFKSRESAIHEYISALFTTGSIFLLIFPVITKNRQMNLRLFFLLGIVLYYIALIPFVKTNLYAVVLYTEITMFIFLFTYYRLDLQHFVAFTNYTFVLYLTFSFVIWIGLLPNIVYDPSFFHVPEFYVDFGIVDYYIMPGFDGSPAGLDVYSAMVLLINMFFNHSKNKKFYILLALIGIILTFRMTPILSLAIVLLLYPFYNNRFLASLMLIVISLMFVIFLYLLISDFAFHYNEQRIDLWSLGYVITHARTMIWEQQLGIFFKEYGFLDYIFGCFSIDLFEVPHFQLWGQMRGEELHGNPHNTFLLLFFRSPMLFMIFFLLFLYFTFKNFKHQKFAVILLIFLAGLTNSAIISLGNPIFIITLVYFLTRKDIYEKQISYGSPRV